MPNESFTQVATATRTLLELPFEKPIVPRMNLTKPWMEEHLSWMLMRSIGFLETGNTEQAYLWLGFVQGALAFRGIPLVELDVVNRAIERLSAYEGPSTVSQT